MLEQNKSFTQFFSKNCGFPKGKALGRTPKSAKLFIRESAFLRARELFAREKVLESRLQVQTSPEKFPVGSFRQ